MRRCKIAFRLCPILLLAGSWVAAQPLEVGPDNVTVDIREWEVPWAGSRPRDPYVGPDGLVWFVGQTADYVASLNPETDEFTRFELEAGTGPHNLIVDHDGVIWYAGNRASHIGRLDPKDGSIKKYPMPDPAAKDPHTLVFNSEGDIWFTLQQSNMVGHLDTGTGEVRLVAVPTPKARPYGIKVDSGGRPWIVLLGTNKLATVDPETFILTEIEMPRPDTARPRRLEIDSSNRIWYVDYVGGRLGRYDPGTGVFKEWITPSGEKYQPYGMAMDDRERLWHVESGANPNRFVGFDPETETFFSITPVPSGGGTVRHMHYDALRRAIWFGADTNTIGRALVP